MPMLFLRESPPEKFVDLEKSAHLSAKHAVVTPRPAHCFPPSPSEKLDALTSLRFFAVCAVFLCHSSTIIASADPSSHGLLLSVLYEGYAGVSFFFTLSGFILCYCYYEKFEKIFEDPSLSRRNAILRFAAQYKDFFVARFARIYPLHLFVLLVAVVLAKVGALVPVLGPTNLGEIKMFRVRAFVAQLYLLQAWFPEGQTPIIHMYNAVSWSLSAESFFYACFPFFCFVMHKTRRASGTFALAYYALTAIVVMDVCSPSSNQADKDAFFAHWFGYYFPGIRLTDFVVGMFSFFWYEKLRAITTRMPNKVVFSAIFEVAPVMLTLLAALAAVKIGVKGWLRYSSWYVPASVCVIVGFAQNGPLASTVFANKWLILLGETSFAFYLIHVMILSAVTTHMHGNVYALVSFAFLATSAASYLAFRIVENPMRKRIIKMMNS